MSTADVLLGILILAVVLLASAITAQRVVSAFLGRDLSGVARWLALALAFAATFFAAQMIPGALGILERETVLAVAIGMAALATLAARRREPTAGPTEASGADGSTAVEPRALGSDLEQRLALAFGALAAFAVAIYLVGSAIEHGTVALLHVDVSSFHLPNIARWIQGNSFWAVDDFIPYRAPGNYPQTGDVFLLGVTLPFSNEFLVRFVGIPFIGLAGLAIFAGSRELGAHPGPAALVAAALASMPCFGYIALRGLADPVMVGTFAVGAYFLLRQWRTNSPADLILAGVGLGLTLGTRWYAVYAVGAVVAVWLAARIVTHHRARLGFAALTLLVPTAVFGGFWLIRNWVESGNPVFPVKVEIASVTIFDAPPDRYRELEGYSLLDYATSPGVWRNIFWPSFLEIMSFVAVFFWALMPIAAVTAWRRLQVDRELAGRMLAMVAIALIIIAAYVVTPYTAVGEEGAPVNGWVNSRYVVPALIVLAPAVAWLISVPGRLGLVLQGLLLLAALDALRRSTHYFEGNVGILALLGGVIVLAAIGAVGYVVYQQRQQAVARRLGLAAAVAVVAVIGVVAFEDRFAKFRHTNLGEPVAIVDAAPAGTRVGLLGEGWGNYPFFGPELANEVEFVGPRVDEMLSTYRTKEGLARALAAGEFDYVYMQDIDALNPALPRRQRAWLSELGWTEIATANNPSFGDRIETALYTPPPS